METTAKKTSQEVVKIVIKDEVRKYRNITSYNKLILAIARTIGYQHLNCRFTYIDDDGDEITVSNEEDLVEAFNFFSPKPPRLSLVSYDESPDLSLAGVKLCDSILDEKPSECFLEPEKEEIIQPDLKMSTIDRPEPVQDEKSLTEFEVFSENDVKQEALPEDIIKEVSAQDFHPEEKKDDQLEVIQQSIISDPRSSLKNQLSVDQDASSEESEVSQNSVEKEEDRIQPAPLAEKSLTDLIAPKLEEDKVEQSDENLNQIDEESRIKIADQEVIKYADLKEKVTELAKAQLNVLLPKIFDECKVFINQQKVEKAKKAHKEQKEENRFKQIVHRNTTCQGCKATPIYGVRYKCLVRENYDLCSKCEDKEGQVYPMLKITTPKQYHEFVKSLVKSKVD